MMEEKMIQFQNAMDEIRKMLWKNGVSAEVNAFDQELPIMVVSIRWGDWKHDHIRAKFLIDDTGDWVFMKTEETETNGSDCYCGDHYFYYKRIFV